MSQASPGLTRAEPVGSLLRPARLLQGRCEHEDGKLAPAQFKRIEDAAVDRAISLQQGAGLDKLRLVADVARRAWPR